MWRFGDLELAAPSGRLLLRGANGTGKTTALEALFPYLLDLNAARLAAGKARPTNLSSLMRDGAQGKRRTGYAWLTLNDPKSGPWSFGVRLLYSEGASPPTRVVPFTVSGRPLHELRLYGSNRESLTAEQFEEAVQKCGGQVFKDDDAYVAHVAARVFNTQGTHEMNELAERIRQLRNPTWLSAISPQEAAGALRSSLPGVAEDVIAATAEALAASDETREAFHRDREAAELLEEFRAAWCAHATEVVRSVHAEAESAVEEVKKRTDAVAARERKLVTAKEAAARAQADLISIEAAIATTTTEIETLKEHEAYKEAGRLRDLEKTLAAEVVAASAREEAMRDAARAAAQRASSQRRQVEELAADLREWTGRVTTADASLAFGGATLEYSERPRPSLSSGEVTADPGSEITVHGDAFAIEEVGRTWSEAAKRHAARAEAAELALIDHGPVAALGGAAVVARQKAQAAAGAAATADDKHERAVSTAAKAVADLLAAIESWASQHHELATAMSLDEPPQDGDRETWSPNQIAELAAREPSEAIAIADTWAATASASAQHRAIELSARSNAMLDGVRRLRRDAAQLRSEAEQLRAGKLLPLPRPEWSGTGDDEGALGAGLDWASSTEEAARPRLEAALVAAGLLGATLGVSSAETSLWRVEIAGPETSPNLLEVLAADPQHSRTSTIEAILARIGLADAAQPREDAPALVIGRDGTFAAGVLHGRAPGSIDPALLAPAQYVGGRQRRQAALRRATELEAEASGLDEIADRDEDQAQLLRVQADAFASAGRAFPSRHRLREAEAVRGQQASAAREARDAADSASKEASHAEREHAAALGAWRERTRANGLPEVIGELASIRDRGHGIASQLELCAAQVGKVASRLRQLLELLSAAASSDNLGEVESTARLARKKAMETAHAVATLKETSGAAIGEVLDRLSKAQKRLDDERAKLDPARGKQRETANEAATLDAHLLNDQGLLATARSLAEVKVHALQSLLVAPGVADAVLDGETVPFGQDLLVVVAAKLPGRRTLVKKAVRERYDQVRTKLAGTWSLDPGDDHGELSTYVLTHGDVSYTPTSAAAHSAMVRDRAEQALHAHEERALRDFVIGRLPSAIGSAWTRLHDWRDDVNTKMRSAAASSGVSVQVRTPLRTDLSAHERAVYELACEVSDAERSPEQQRQLGDALKALLSASEGDTMQQRVANAVDVREWVEVFYEVMRPDGKAHRWNSRTGLSSGERRLVVIAPMLAAIAAAYDVFGGSALRLVALDEVPAEVDERGREGLARFIAELDLDLVCTSYVWDGCPGAWDGIDAHDLEAGPDGTVVSYPMLVRGVTDIPDDLKVGAPGTKP